MISTLYSLTQKLLALIQVLLMFAFCSAAEASCKVSDPELSTGVYQGDCNALGMASGLGKILSADGLISYTGEFLDGMKHGTGRKTFASGDIYQGQWYKDQRFGTGSYIFGERSPWRGDRYEGQWQADQMNGMGTYSWAMGDVYTGRWKNNLQLDGITSAQARRAAYAKAFVQGLQKTKNQACPNASSVYYSVHHAKIQGSVSAVQANRASPPSLGRAPLEARVASIQADRVYLVFIAPESAPVAASHVEKKQNLTPAPAWQLVSDWYPCTHFW